MKKVNVFKKKRVLALNVSTNENIN